MPTRTITHADGSVSVAGYQDSSTSAGRDENRLTDEDRDGMARRVREVLATWRECKGPNASSDLDTLVRIAHHAIGCGAADLRDSELAEIRAMCAALVAGRS